MKLLVNWLILCGISGVLLASCFDPPTYSPIPSIEDGGVVFKDVADPSAADSLILSVKFKDGDGDLGLDPSETGCYNISGKNVCFNEKFYYKLADGTFITYKTRRTNKLFDTLPAFIKPYNCINWEVSNVNSKVDTFYFQLNPDYHNIFVDFFVQNQNTGVFEEFDWETQFGYPQCALNFDGRFPILSKDLSQKTPLEGTIRYAMQSVGFLPLFSTKAMKLRVTIQDRQLNKSNTIETQPFSLK